MLSDMASEPHRLGLWVPHNSHVSRNPGSGEKRVGEDWRGKMINLMNLPIGSRWPMSGDRGR